ncbi:MAG: hypothetical protein WCI88_02675 [Chloroflexota bacterium]
MNLIEEQITRGKVTALEVGLQSDSVPFRLIKKDAQKMLERNDLPEDLRRRLVALVQASGKEVSKEAGEG